MSYVWEPCSNIPGDINLIVDDHLVAYIRKSGSGFKVRLSNGVGNSFRSIEPPPLATIKTLEQAKELAVKHVVMERLS